MKLVGLFVMLAIGVLELTWLAYLAPWWLVPFAAIPPLVFVGLIVHEFHERDAR